MAPDYPGANLLDGSLKIGALSGFDIVSVNNADFAPISQLTSKHITNFTIHIS
jgi:hypothetical protein